MEGQAILLWGVLAAEGWLDLVPRSKTVIHPIKPEAGSELFAFWDPPPNYL
jgi:hypothetical protein